MNWKYFIGKNIKIFEDTLTKSNSEFIIKNYPFGRNWVYDLKRILKHSPNIIIDAGANVGDVSKELAYFFPNSIIYAFEPVLKTYNILKSNTLKFKNINPLPFALGKTEDEIEIYLNAENTINSLKSNYLNEGNSIGKEIIKVKRLDYYCNSANIYQIDILKIDVEGFEFEVLEGCGEMLIKNIDCILLEVGYEREDTKVHFSEVESYLEKYNYQLCGIYNIMRNLNDKRKIAYSNNLYIKKYLI